MQRFFSRKIDLLPVTQLTGPCSWIHLLFSAQYSTWLCSNNTVSQETPKIAEQSINYHVNGLELRELLLVMFHYFRRSQFKLTPINLRRIPLISQILTSEEIKAVSKFQTIFSKDYWYHKFTNCNATKKIQKKSPWLEGRFPFNIPTAHILNTYPRKEKNNKIPVTLKQCNKYLLLYTC